MITTKQRAKLKSISMKEDTSVIIGKDGLTDNIIKSIEQLLVARELVKIKVLDTLDATPRELIAEVCERLVAEPVLVIGNKFIVYKRRKSNDKPHLL